MNILWPIQTRYIQKPKNRNKLIDEKIMQSHNLERFVTAQFPVYERVVQELLFGCKTGHWMWFIFPQIKGLGESDQSKYYAIRSIDEARVYLEHDILGSRLLDCTMLVCKHADKTAVDIFGETDALKFHSCITLFEMADEPGGDFSEALQLFYDGEQDTRTVSLAR